MNQGDDDDDHGGSTKSEATEQGSNNIGHTPHSPHPSLFWVCVSAIAHSSQRLMGDEHSVRLRKWLLNCGMEGTVAILSSGIIYQYKKKNRQRRPTDRETVCPRIQEQREISIISTWSTVESQSSNAGW